MGEPINRPFVTVLGIAQDGGYPQAGCTGECCSAAWLDPARSRRVACLGIVDTDRDSAWLIDATPDFPAQLHGLSSLLGRDAQSSLQGIFLTHAHMGHYTGLLHLGKEAANFDHLPVFAMPRMARFLMSNSPWDRLESDGNIELRRLEAGVPVSLSDGLSISPLPVEHRGEHSETVGFRISSEAGFALYVPDIDRLVGMTPPLEAELQSATRVYFDGTFYDGSELPGRDLRSIPHPLVAETIAHLAHLPSNAKNRLAFIHLNHTNPLLRPGSNATAEVRRAGFDIAEEGEIVYL
jgi:pyrroloquinoline quinone biosynthesis protein B